MSALILGGSSQHCPGSESVCTAIESVPIPFLSQVELDLSCSLWSQAVDQSRLSLLSKLPPWALVDNKKKKNLFILFNKPT